VAFFSSFSFFFSIFFSMERSSSISSKALHIEHRVFQNFPAFQITIVAKVPKQ
jgi:hypothetical protein